MVRRLHGSALIVLTALAAGAGVDAPPTPPTAPPALATSVPLDRITVPDEGWRTRFDLAPVHTRMVDLDGFPILGSERVPDAALREAAHVVRSMIRGRPALLAPIVAARIRLVVMNHDEFTTDVPEHADLEPAAYWDRRARGLGATVARPAASCGAENLLAYTGDPHAGESILVHEFAHVLHEFALAALDPSFDRRLADAYTAAMTDGLWAGTYASTNHHEYFAEAVQSYFDANRQDDGEHGPVDTREELAAHDPRMFALIEEALGSNPWRYRPVLERLETPHLAGHDRAAAPRFEWPERIVAAWERHRAASRTARTPLPWTVATDGRVPPASVDDGERTRVRFVNRRRDAVRLVWIDTLGQPRGYGWVRARGAREQATFAGHVWMLMDAEGRPIGWTVAQTEPGEVAIAGPPAPDTAPAD